MSATAEAPANPFADLIPQDLIGGENGAPAFQVGGGRFEPVPRAEVNTPTELGAFADLVPPGAPSAHSMDYGAFTDLVPESPTGEAEKALAETPTAFETKLSPDEEDAFWKWQLEHAPGDSGDDYDLRGAFKAGITPDIMGHFPDTFKKPNHPTFSVESVYAKDRPDLAGHWELGRFIAPDQKKRDQAAFKTDPLIAAEKGLNAGTGLPVHEAMNAVRVFGAAAGKYIFNGLQGLELNRAKLLQHPTLEMVQPQGDETILPDGSAMSKEQVDALERQYVRDAQAGVPDALAKAEYWKMRAGGAEAQSFVDPELAKTVPARLAHTSGEAAMMGMESLIPGVGVPLMVVHGSLATEAEARNAGQSPAQAEAAGVRSAIGLAIFGGVSKLAALGVARLLPQGSETLTKFVAQFTGQEAANETSSRALAAWDAAAQAPEGQKVQAAMEAMKDTSLEATTLNTVYALMHASRAAGQRASVRPASASEPGAAPERGAVLEKVQGAEPAAGATSPDRTADAVPPALPPESTPLQSTETTSPARTAELVEPEARYASEDQLLRPEQAPSGTRPASPVDPQISQPEPIPSPERAQLQKAVDAAPEPSLLHSTLEKLGMTREDLHAVGITAPGTVRTGKLIDAGARMVRDIADTVGGKAVPKLTRAGVMDEAVQHASARQYVPALVQELQAKVFPTKYKSNEAMAKTIDVIKADNILGGYDEARTELEALRQATEPSPKKLADQEEFVKNIEESQNLPALDALVRSAKGTDIEADIKRWEQHVTPLMDSLYNEIKGADPNTPRETRGRHYGARMNLLPEAKAAEMEAWSDPNSPMPEVSVSNYRNPNVKRDRFMRQAKLTGAYSSDPNLVLLNSFASRWNEVTKQRLYRALEEKGVAAIAEPGDPPVTEINGKPAARLPIKMPETNPETGRTQMVEKSLYVQRDLVNEIRNVLNTDGRLTQNKFFQGVTQLQLLQLADATAHTKNIHSVVVNALGGTNIGKDLLRKVPGLGTAAAVGEITRVSKQIASDSPAIRAEIAELTKRGMVRPEYPATGIQRLTRMQQLIHDVDTASRVIINRRFTNLVQRGLAKDTVENRRNFVQQIGEYNRRLMSRQEAYLRDYGLSPFIVAGRTFNRFSRRLMVGSPGFETASGKAAVAARAAQVSGLVFAATVPAVINMFTTGSMGGREGTPVGAIDFGPDYDTEDGKHRVLDLFQLVGIRRGLRGTGLEAVMEGYRNGQTWNEITGKAADGVVTTSLHPYVGPGVGGLYQTLTGKRVDLRSGWTVAVPESRKVGGIGQWAENFRVALKTQNPFIYGIVQNGLQNGMDKVFGIPPEEDAPSALSQTMSGLFKSSLSAVGYKELKPPGGTTKTQSASMPTSARPRKAGAIY